MFLLVGLGNPGPKYAGNRHNIGFMAVDEIAHQHSFGPWRSKFQGEICEGRLGRHKALLLKPTTYMNESGRSVSQACRFYKIAAKDVFIFHDELDLQPGKVKAKLGGGTAGHNGLRSTGAHIGNDFHRIRLGIGHPGKDRVTQWVLGDFAKADRDWLEPMLDGLATTAPRLLEGDLGRFMTDLSKKLNPPEPKPTKGPGEKSSALLNKTISNNQNKPTSSDKKADQPENAMADALRKLIGKHKDN